MRKETFVQIEVVEGETAKDLQCNFNSKMRELAQANCKVFRDKLDINADDLIAVILYEVTESYMDCVADEFHAEGIYFHCRNCPYLEDPKDRRVKHCNCKYAEYGHTHKDSEACEMFYKQMKQNKVTPIPD